MRIKGFRYASFLIPEICYLAIIVIIKGPYWKIVGCTQPSSASYRHRWILEQMGDVAVVCILETSLYFRDFHFRGCTLTGGSSWKTITYRWLWIFRGSGSALFRSRECYGAEFSTVLFPLRHVPPLLPFIVTREIDREEKEQTNTANTVAKVKFPLWLSRLFPGARVRRSDGSENTRTKLSGRR